jgi:hypothetical protein
LKAGEVAVRKLEFLDYSSRILSGRSRWGVCSGSGGGQMERVKKGEWYMYFIYLNENRIEKLVEIILSRQEGGKGDCGEDKSNQGIL